ncbi:MAG TPA: hypothetical protein VGQ09_21550 [Chitinophagaceae bacterium]|jgi:uncharacterized protein involved in exopolysaccharide biosynthesis|nr:hypothetical protein [Chitinophagaceae bacterium]
MPDLFDLFLRWWKQILSLIIATLIITIVIVFLMPKQYLATATALPASTYATDKTLVFGQNLQSVYSALGSPDDLDIILGTARLDTVFIAVAERLNLVAQYKINNNDTASIQKAAAILKKRTRVIKSDYGELKVKVWDHNRNLAADMANAIMEKLQQIHQDVQTSNNVTILSKLDNEYAEKKVDYQKLLDSLQHTNNVAVVDLLNSQKTSSLQQIQEYEKLLSQYKLMVDSKPQALIVIERAKPPLKADKPRPIQTIIAAAILSLFFALLAALVLERRRMVKA